MKNLYPLHGIVTVLNTPFSAANQLDLAALQSNVGEALKAGVSGFLVPAMASEVQKLSNAEKLEMVETVLKTVNGVVPVFAGTASASVRESGELIKSYQELGCKHCLIQIPYISDDQFKADFYALADKGPDVIMLQDWDAHGYGLPDQLIMELFEKVPIFPLPESRDRSGRGQIFQNTRAISWNAECEWRMGGFTNAGRSAAGSACLYANRHALDLYQNIQPISWR
jgi:hypothetical protein